MFQDYKNTLIVQEIRASISNYMAKARDRYPKSDEDRKRFDYNEDNVDDVLETALIMLDCSFAKEPELFEDYPQITEFLNNCDFRVAEDPINDYIEYCFNLSGEYQNEEELSDETINFINRMSENVVDKIASTMAKTNCDWVACDEAYSNALFEVLKEANAPDFSTKDWSLIEKYGCGINFTPLDKEFLSEISQTNPFKRIFERSKGNDLSLEF